MKLKNKIKSLLVIPLVFIVSGCGLTAKLDGGVYKSTDGGQTFGQKTFVGEKASIANVDVLSLEIDPLNSQTIYIGTAKTGVYRSTDGGETWTADINKFTNITSIVIDPNSSQTIYIAAVKDSRGKIFKTTDGGGDWKEIYTLNTDGPTVASLTLDKANPNVLYAGTSNGGVFKTEDGGTSWRSLFWGKSSIRKIVIDRINREVIYFGTTSSGALVSKDGGKTFSEIKKSGYIYNILTHPAVEGMVFLSDKEGLQKSSDFGKTWSIINTLVKPEDLGSRGLDINPNNPAEIYYASAKAFYKSSDGGNAWSPVQFNTSRAIEIIKIDPNNSQNIYLGMYNREGISNIKLFP